MSYKKYKSFKELDTDLRLLKLKKDIAFWSLKNNCTHFQSKLSTKNIVLGIVRSLTNTDASFNWSKIFRNVTLAYLIKRVLKR